MKHEADRGQPHPSLFLGIGAVTAVLSAIALFSSSPVAHLFGWFFGSVLGLTSAGLTRRAERVRIEAGGSPLGRASQIGLAALMAVSFALGMVNAFFLGWEWA